MGRHHARRAGPGLDDDWHFLIALTLGLLGWLIVVYVIGVR